ncbi:MAG TPA: hypothetical protein VNQ76_03300 [Planctomicrobium sp.]|nr:hypothetical protein [Planctomicrobium sp.]
MTSTRAPAVAEVLWELKRLDKIARFSDIAARVGFNPGANGRAMNTCLESIRKEWPHLQVWRAIRDDGAVEAASPQYQELQAWGATFSDSSDGRYAGLQIDESRVMIWEVPSAPKTASQTTEA